MDGKVNEGGLVEELMDQGNVCWCAWRGLVDDFVDGVGK